MAAKYQNISDGKMTMPNFLFHAAGVYASLTKTIQPDDLLFTMPARWSPAEGNRSDMRQ